MVQFPQIRIIFPVILRYAQFDNQEVILGGVYPIIEIKLIDSNTGLHEFSILKPVPNSHPSMVNPAIAEAEYQMNYFWDILSYVRNTVIQPTGEILYEFNGNRYVAKRPNIQDNINITEIANKDWIGARKSDFHKKYNMDLLKRYNYSLSIKEPIGKFISLYSLLSSIAKDKQHLIDKQIESVDPNVAKYFPAQRKSETIYTRLRNELAHIRDGTSIMQTHSEIILHLPRFEWIIKEILSKHILLS
jgi:hypothetical protein